MRRHVAALVAGLAAAVCAACPLLGRDAETFRGSAESEDRIPVVDDVGEFDPSEAVDDDDGAVVIDASADPTDRPPFAEDESAPPEAAAENEREKKDAEPGAAGEPVADEVEAETREAALERAAESAEETGDEDAAKVALGQNPPPEPTVESKREPAKVRDFVLETLVVAAVAALVTAALVFARSHPKLVAVGVVLAAALAAFVVSQSG